MTFRPESVLHPEQVEDRRGTKKRWQGIRARPKHRRTAPYQIKSRLPQRTRLTRRAQDWRRTAAATLDWWRQNT